MAETPQPPREDGENAERAGPEGPSESAAHAKERSRDDPEVRAWVSRFADPQGPPRIGSRAGMDDSVFLSGYEADEPEAAEAPASAGEESPAPETGGSPDPTAAVKARLAARLARARRTPRHARGPSGVTVAAVAVAALGLAALLVWVGTRLGARGEPSRVASATPSPEAPAVSAEARSQLPAPAQSPGASPSSATSPTPAPVAPPPAAPAPASAPAQATPATDQDAQPVRTFALEVATFINRDRAQSECELLAESTHLRARLRTRTGSDGVATYRVLLGRFDDEQTAETAADDLLSRGLVGEARVVSVIARPKGPR